MPNKTLVVTYLPRGEHSHTKKLLDAFLKEAKNLKPEILDLTKDVPDLFMPESVMGYIYRNYLGQTLTKEQQESLKKMDRMASQFKQADTVVLATPMFNFSLPAVVKAYFDSVMLKGETWDIVGGNYSGLMKGKRAMILLASGGVYEGKMAPWEHAVSLAKVEFEFMGFEDIRCVHAAGMNAGTAIKEKNLTQGIESARAIAREWY